MNGFTGGVCLDVFHSDGLIDIFATDYGMQGQSKLLLNNGKGSYDDHTQESGIEGLVG